MVPNRQAYHSTQTGAQSQLPQESKTSQAPLLPMEIPAPAPPPILLVKDDSVCIGDLFSELLNDDEDGGEDDSTSPPQRGVVATDAAAQVEASEYRAYSMPSKHQPLQDPHHHQQQQPQQQQHHVPLTSMALRAPPFGLQHRQTGCVRQQHKLEYPPSSITTTRLSTCGSSLPPVPHLPPPITVPPMHILRDSHAMSLSTPKTVPAPHVHGLTRDNFITAHVENDHQPNGFAETPRSTTSSCGGGNKRRRTPRSRSNSYFDDDTLNDDDFDDDDEEYDPASDESTVGCPSVGAPMSKKITSKCGSRKHKLTEAQRIERREKNRLHAARSRMRKKKTIESLQESVEALRAENERLRDAIRLGGLVMHPVLPPVMHTRKLDPHVTHTHTHPHVYGVAM